MLYKFSDEKLYWTKILITIIFGISNYYLLEFVMPNLGYFFYLPLWNNLRNLVITFVIYLITLITIPYLILAIKEEHGHWISFKRTMKGFGTQFSLYILLYTLTYFINIW